MEQNIAETPFFFNAWGWVEKNLKALAIGAVVLAVVGFGLAYSAWSNKAKELAAGQELSQAIFSQAANALGSTVAAESLLKVAATHSGTPAGAQALMLGASALFNAAKYAEAQAAFERFVRDYSRNDLVPQALYGRGAAQAALGNLDEAARAYKESFDRFPNSPIAKQAKFSLASVYTTQGKLEQALPLYEDLSRTATGNSLGNEAAQRAEELRAKLPPIAFSDSVTPTSSNAPAAKP